MMQNEFSSGSSNLVWETLQRALNFRDDTIYIVQEAGKKIDITSSIEALSAFCESWHDMTNLFAHLENATIESFTPITFRMQKGRAVVFQSGNIVKLFDKNVLKRTLTTKDPDTIGRTLSFLRGY